MQHENRATRSSHEALDTLEGVDEVHGEEPLSRFLALAVAADTPAHGHSAACAKTRHGSLEMRAAHLQTGTLVQKKLMNAEELSQVSEPILCSQDTSAGSVTVPL
jgi:hypothetical protein